MAETGEYSAIVKRLAGLQPGEENALGCGESVPSPAIDEGGDVVQGRLLKR
jgi:hypothetical protein